MAIFICIGSDKRRLHSKEKDLKDNHAQNAADVTGAVKVAALDTTVDEMLNDENDLKWNGIADR